MIATLTQQRLCTTTLVLLHTHIEGRGSVGKRVRYWLSTAGMLS
jgi:hypothetical protein